MTQYDFYEVKTNLIQIAKLLEEKVEDEVVVIRNGKPFLKITLIDEDKRKNFFGCAKEMFTIPDNFDDIDISEDFK